MKFGLSVTGLSPRYYPQVSLAAEAAGFESVWVPDHLVFPEEMPATYYYTESGLPPMDAATAVYDPWVLLGGIATATNTIRLGTNVYVLPLRHPLVTARAVLTVDRLSHGRITLGAGVGWLEDEFRAAGESFRNRGKRTDEIIPLMRRLWTETVIEHRGEYYDFDPLRFEPKPFQRDGIPIEIGGTSPAALNRAGALGDGWIEIGIQDEDAFAAMLAVINEARRKADRDHLPFIVTGRADNDADSVRRAEERGVDRVILNPGSFDSPPTGQTYVDAIERYQHEVIAKM